MREPPGVGAALNSLPQLPGCPQLLKAQIRGAGGGGGGGVRSLGGSIHTAALADPGRARDSLGASAQWGWGAGQRERPSRRHPPLLPPRALRWPVGHRPPPHLPFSAFASVGASGHWRAAPGEQGMSPLHPCVVRVGMGLLIGEGGLEGGAGGSTRAGTSE